LTNGVFAWLTSREYDSDFLQACDVVFVSHEKLPVAPEDFVSRDSQFVRLVGAQKHANYRTKNHAK
jgi:hypothetical protein